LKTPTTTFFLYLQLVQKAKAPIKTNTLALVFFVLKDCVKDCSLHLTGLTSSRGRVYSNKNAVGLVIATGNEGKFLFDMHHGMNTYISRNGGLSWVVARPGSRIYEIGNHGNIIVMAEDTKPTTKIEYTLDQGLNWTEFEFAKSPVLVKNILTEPLSVSQTFLIVATRKTSFGTGGVVWMVDFSSEQPRVCQGAEIGQVGGDDSDFEIWSPGEGVFLFFLFFSCGLWDLLYATRRNLMCVGRFDNRCLMGRKIELVRRKQTAYCYTSENDEEPIEIRYNCPCRTADYECSIGYNRDKEQSCVRDYSVDINFTLAQPKYCPVGSSYPVSRGYRRIPGDSCRVVADDNYDDVFEPMLVRCKGRSVIGISLRGWFVLFVFGFLAWMLWRPTSKSCRTAVRDKATWLANLGRGRLGYHNLEQVPDFSDDFGVDFAWAEEEEEVRAGQLGNMKNDEVQDDEGDDV